MPQTTALAIETVDTSAIDRAMLGDRTKLKYKRAVDNMFIAGVNPLDMRQLVEYANSLKSSSKAFLKAGLRIMNLEFSNELKGRATPQNIAVTQAALLRMEAMSAAIKVKQSKGEKAHVWLSQKQVGQITGLCKNTLEGKRDWIILAVLVGAGLRREELAELTFQSLKTQHKKDGTDRHVLQVHGKGAKDRIVPIRDMLAKRLIEWREETHGGRIARAIVGKKNKHLTDSISPVGIFDIVHKYGMLIGVPELAPHDLRRSYAQLGYEAGIPITQISKLLGHADVRTTQRYLNLSLNLEVTASDFIELEG